MSEGTIELASVVHRHTNLGWHKVTFPLIAKLEIHEHAFIPQAIRNPFFLGISLSHTYFTFPYISPHNHISPLLEPVTPAI